MSFGNSKSYSKKGYAEHPCKVFLYLDYKNSKIKGWDSEKKEKVEFDLDFPFVFIWHTMGIGWWDTDNKVKLYSNEVDNIKDEGLEVYEWVNKERTVIATWKWNDIKDEIKGKGWILQTNIYVMDKDNNVYDIQVSGWAMFDIVGQLQKIGQNFVKISGVAEKENNGFKFKSAKIEKVWTVDANTKENIKEIQDDFNTYFSEKKEELELEYSSKKNKKKDDDFDLPF